MLSALLLPTMVMDAHTRICSSSAPLRAAPSLLIALAIGKSMALVRMTSLNIKTRDAEHMR